MGARAKDNTYNAMVGLPGITMITMNMGSDGSKNDDGSKKDTAENRRIVVDLVVKHRKPDILFAQELMAPQTPKWKLDVNDEYQFYNSEKEAGLMWNENMFCLHKKIDMGNKQEILQKFENTGRWNKDSLSVIPARICAVCLQHKATKNYILAVSWHGRWRAPEDIRKESLIILQRFTLEIRRRFLGTLNPQPAIIIGGDFNLDCKPAEIHHEFRRPKYKTTERRLERSDEIIDYFLHTSDIEVNKIEPLILWHKNGAQTFHRGNYHKDILFSVDHDPIECIFSFATTVNNGNNPPTLQNIRQAMRELNEDSISSLPLNKKIQKPDKFQVDGEEEIKAICEVCGKDCLSYNNLISHLKIHAQTTSKPVNEIFRCSDCARICKTKTSLNSHQRTHQNKSDNQSDNQSPDGKFHCPVCDMVCRTGAGLASHQRTHLDKTTKVYCRNQTSSDEDEYPCPDCNMICRSGAGLASHQRTHLDKTTKGSCRNDSSSDEEEYSCPDCDMICRSGAGLASHQRTHLDKTTKVYCRNQTSSDEEEYSCPDCNMICRSGAGLASHQRTHLDKTTKLSCRNPTSSDDEEYPCPDCNMICRSGAGLASHQRTHFNRSTKIPCKNQSSSDDEEYPCPDCNMICRSGAGLASHQRIHKNKPATTSSSDHSSSFGGGKYPCPDCDMSCRSAAGLASHLRTHKNKPPTTTSSKQMIHLNKPSKHSQSNKSSPTDQPHQCPECGMICKSKAGLCSHQRVHKKK